MSRRLGLLLLVAALPLALWGALPMLSGAESPQSIQHKIDAKQKKIDAHKGRERVLTGDISAATSRINTLQSDITQLQTKQVRLESDLAAKREELAEIQEDLRRERLRLARLRERLAEARVLLANRLVEIYKSDPPDVVTVVLESDGFRDLLERAEFMQRASEDDARIIARVTKTKLETAASEARLEKLEKRAEAVAKAIEGQVQQVVAVKTTLVSRRNSFQAVRADKATMLASTRSSRHALEEDVASLQKEQAAIIARLQSSSSPAAGPIQSSGGPWIWPVSGTITSPFCESRSWEACHPGVDIAVPTGTPIRAAAGGRVAIAGWTGGYGNYTCIQHTASLTSCYGHQSSIGVSVGQQVSQGQVIGAVGSTGFSTGPHLHFEARVNGSVVNPMNYL
ncbi:MAG TPA: peptidoglycan DD-metalloendopeptidase family protein [Solirubrobacteraceae bacterium]|nr:peptidoglycan DD-metalloendopeptidase family protein [Solirubrobacteraceae bacterium]